MTSAAALKNLQSPGAEDEEPSYYNEEAELEQFNVKLVQFGQSIDQNVLEAEGSLTAATTEDEFGPPVEAEMLPKQRPPVESSSSEAVVDSDVVMQQETDDKR